MLNFKYKARKATSFLETMIVLIIAGVFFAFAAPSYAKYIEKSKAKRAAANLDVIYNMEKMYKLDNGTYYICSTNSCSAYKDSRGNPYYYCLTPCNLQSINDQLNLFLADKYFTYKIDIEDGSVGTYKITAKRLQGGMCSEKTITMTSTSRQITKNCDIW